MAIVAVDTAAAAAHRKGARDASLAEARELLQRAVRDARTLSYLLHPPLLDECGLAVALATYAKGFARRSELECELDLDDTPLGAMPPLLEMALFRIA